MNLVTGVLVNAPHTAQRAMSQRRLSEGKCHMLQRDQRGCQSLRLRLSQAFLRLTGRESVMLWGGPGGRVWMAWADAGLFEGQYQSTVQFLK